MFKSKYIRNLEEENTILANSLEKEQQLNKTLLEKMHQDSTTICDLREDNYHQSQLLASQKSLIDDLTAQNECLKRKLKRNSDLCSISYLPQAFSEDIIAAIRDDLHAYDF